ncbi:protease inhibitor 1-like [Candoia aspera]|uniref:protease inhibitor 1-like n=1 Tax=Candoia aspera TaxID=51853 RepID=UPI002FD7B2C6
MKAVRGLLLLLGLLTLLAELPLSGGQKPGRCLLPAVTGPCRAYKRRFFYNRASRRCGRFIYGGCRGNANNFKTLQECRFTCEGSQVKGEACPVSREASCLLDLTLLELYVLPGGPSSLLVANPSRSFLPPPSASPPPESVSAAA